MTTVLLAIAARDQRTFIANQLAADSCRVTPAAYYGEAVLAAQTDVVAAAIVDLSLPEHGGLRLLREIRAAHHHDMPADMPVLALLRDGDGELELARAFGAGADDVARQPVSYVELRCRLEALLRRSQPTRAQGRRRRVGELEIDLGARMAKVAERGIELSRLEFDLLAVLSADPRRVFGKDELLKEIWGIPDGVTTRTLDSHACRLRGKLAKVGGHYIANRWGVGYSLLPPS